ncbi:phytoene synthase [Longibacter salinarum]|uniref:Phytoene synthase n=1 Tax=Longibacter salinarum TaxID=1850348 RepID=A0A2A8D284_9BACT|nr:phytoene/squalene synthase family protein [Longibacter salinarum]PEN14994.1 phytoene synthase [Longibacter salinarum]
MSTATLDTRADEDQWIWTSFRHHSRTFSLATRFLPRSVQMPIATLYLFCRRVDTLADDRVLEVGAAQTLRELDELNAALDKTLLGNPPVENILWRRLHEVHQTYQLDREPLYELIAGARWDLEGETVDTLDDLIYYSNLVGGSVGAMMLPFLVDDDRHRDELEEPARKLGIAMQITNILRDVGEDARRLDRIYLPSTWMQDHGVNPDDLESGTVPPNYSELLEPIMEEAEWRYLEGFSGIDALPWKCRTGIRGAARMYREIMNEVRANGYDNLNHRAYASLGRKLFLVAIDNYEARKNRLKTRAPHVAA